MFLQKEPNRFFSIKEIAEGTNCVNLININLLMTKLIRYDEVSFKFEGRRKMYKVKTKKDKDFNDFMEILRQERLEFTEIRQDDFILASILYELRRKNGSKRIQK